MVYYWKKKIEYYFPYFGGGGASESMEISILFFNPSLRIFKRPMFKSLQFAINIGDMVAKYVRGRAWVLLIILRGGEV